MAARSNAEVFDTIYRYHLWGVGSGTGSISFLNRPFIRFLNSFLVEHPDIQSVVDIGCGDWQIARHIDFGDREYIGCDVSRVVLDKTEARYGGPHRRFVMLDAVADELPEADLAIVKDVLLHLANADIARVLAKLTRYRYVIIQSEVSDDALRNNKDISNGFFRPVDIEAAPFVASGYRKASSYYEGIRLPFYLIFRLFGFPTTRKVIYVRGG